MVAEEGNKRQGSMSPAEIQQCVTDVAAWFERQGVAPEPCSRPDLEALQKTLGTELPPALGGEAGMLEVLGVSCWYYERRALSSDALSTEAERLGVRDGSIIPFASDVDGNLYVVDTSTKNDAVFEWDAEEGADGRGEQVASSFEDFLERLRNDLLSGSFEYVDECGVVEGMGGGEGKSSHK